MIREEMSKNISECVCAGNGRISGILFDIIVQVCEN